MRISPQGVPAAGDLLSSHEERIVKDLWYSKRVKDQLVGEQKPKNSLSIVAGNKRSSEIADGNLGANR